MTTKAKPESDEPVAVPRCWSYNKQRQRCDLPGGHLGDHAVSATWSDQDSFDPEIDTLVTFVDKPVPFVVNEHGKGEALSPAEQAMLDEQQAYDDLGAVPGGPCFSCGCVEEAHPCDAHGCKSYVP